MPEVNGRILDRRIPTDFKHVEKHPIMGSKRFAALDVAPQTTDFILDVQRNYRDHYDQGNLGACVGYSQSWMMSILNRMKYDAKWLYNQAQLADEWPETPPEEGTSCRAGFDVLRAQGHMRIWGGHDIGPKPLWGISSNRWATVIDEIRTALFAGIPVNFGINWYDAFFDPTTKPRLHGSAIAVAAAPVNIERMNVTRYDYWIGLGTGWGNIAGGHAITAVGFCDTRQAIAWCNTWGTSYPFIVWIPYTAVERLLNEDGEAGVVVDR